MLPTSRYIRNTKIISAIISLMFGLGISIGALILPVGPAGRYSLLSASIATVIIAYLFGTARARRRLVTLAHAFPDAWDKILNERVAFYKVLEGDDKIRFQQMVMIFLDETRITGIDVELDDICRLLVAASAIIPIFAFPQWEYSTLREVLVYPHRFDSEDGLDGSDGNTLGMVGNTGSAINGLMVLSKPDLLHGYKHHGDRHNVGIHEFAHLVDKASGAIDGIPAGMPSHCIKPWLELVNRELSEQRDEYGKLKRISSDIPAYGYTNQQEFLAVTTEYFFESPDKLAKHHPEIYEMLERSFGQNTRARFKGFLQRILRPVSRQTGRNAPCPCGSGTKYKKCCMKKARRRRKGKSAPSGRSG